MLRVFHFLALYLGLSLSQAALPPSGPGSGQLTLSGLPYPYPVHYYTFMTQGQNLSMAYMDVLPHASKSPSTLSSSSQSNGKTVVLLHGKNFCGITWNETIHVLSSAGYRVIVPEQIGFCKSSKPHYYQYSLFQLALNTYNLLIQHLGIPRATVMGHSMGGMTSVRFSLMFPNVTERLVLVDPLGLENWFEAGIPYVSIDTWYATEVVMNYTSIKAYEQATYYGGNWSDAYTPWAEMLAAIYQNPVEGKTFAWDMSLVDNAVSTQPILQELPDIKVKETLLFVGDKDNTAIGKQFAPPAVQAKVGNYSALGKRAAALIPNCTLVEFADLGHSPQIQDPKTFHEKLMAWLGSGR